MTSCPECERHVHCIEHVPIFGSLNAEERMEIAQIAEERRFRKGEMVYRAGDAGGKLFVLHTGRAKLFRLSAGGREQVLGVIEPGDFMGELSLFSALALTGSAQALKDSAMCVLDGDRLKVLMVKYPSIAFKVMDALSRRLETAESRIEAIGFGSVARRVAQALLDLSRDGREVALPMTKGDFASQLGMSQETLSRKLAALQEEGLIALKGRKIILKDKEELMAISRE